MELRDAAFDLVESVECFTDADEACANVDVAIMVGGFPRKSGMERKDVLGKNVAIYKAQAAALASKAKRDVKIVVVANPANTNAKILAKFAPSIPKTNITCLTRLDHNRALAQLSERSGKPTREVKNTIIWGNHSSTQYPDVNHATIGGKPARDVVGDDAYLDGNFVDVVRKRGAAIIEARKLSSALSAASSVCDHVYDWIYGTKEGEWTSMGVVSDGSYGIPEGLVYSFPVTCTGGKWQIVQGLNIDERSRKLMDESAQELTEEFAVAEECLAESA
jgi:malate dehydrogenase